MSCSACSISHLHRWDVAAELFVNICFNPFQNKHALCFFVVNQIQATKDQHEGKIFTCSQDSVGTFFPFKEKCSLVDS